MEVITLSVARFDQPWGNKQIHVSQQGAIAGWQITTNMTQRFSISLGKTWKTTSGPSSPRKQATELPNQRIR